MISPNIPVLFFIVGAYINFKMIQHIGFDRVVNFSTSFKIKRILCILMALLDLSIIIITIAAPGLIDDNACNYELCMGSQGEHGSHETATLALIVVTRVLSIISWIISWRLLEYQYRKGLSE